MRRTIQKQTPVTIFLCLRGKFIYLVAFLCSLLSQAQLYISDSTIITNIHEIYVVKPDTIATVKNNISTNKKLSKPNSSIGNKIAKQIKLKKVNPPNQFYHNNSSKYFIYPTGRNPEAVTPTTQFHKSIAFLNTIDLPSYFIDKERLNLIKYKDNRTISSFYKITLARPPPQL